MTLKPTKIAVLTVLASMAVSLPSCLEHKEEEYTFTQNITNYFNYVIDHSTGSTAYYGNISYNITYNYTKYLADITMTGFQLPGGKSYPTLNFSQSAFTVNNAGWKTVNIKNDVPSGSGSFAQAPTFNDVNFSLIDRTISDAYYPVTDISFTVDGIYTIYSLPQQLVEMPDVVVKDPNGDEYVVLEDEAPIYIMSMDIANGKATLKIRGAKFASVMPAMNMQFTGIDFNVTSQGNIVFSADALIPDLLTGSGSTPTVTPAPNFPISSLTGTFDPDKGLVMDYVCTVQMSEQAPGVAYTVHAVSEYPTESTGW